MPSCSYTRNIVIIALIVCKIAYYSGNRLQNVTSSRSKAQVRSCDSARIRSAIVNPEAVASHLVGCCLLALASVRMVIAEFVEKLWRGINSLVWRCRLILFQLGVCSALLVQLLLFNLGQTENDLTIQWQVLVPYTQSNLFQMIQ